MEYIISLVLIFLELLNYMFFSDAFLERRRGKKATIISFCITWLVMFGYSRFVPSTTIKMILTLACSVCLSHYLFKGFWLRHILCFLLSYTFGALADVLIVYGASSLLKVSLSELIWKQLLYTIVCIVSKLLFTLAAYIIRRIRKPSGPQTIRIKWLFLTLLFPLISIFMLIMISDTYKAQPDISIGTFIFCGILIIANIAILYLISIMEKSMKKEQELILLNQNMEIQTKNLLALEKNFQNQRKATHEFKNQLSTIRNLLDSNQLEAAQKYVNQLEASHSVRTYSVRSSHPIIDAVINQKYQEAKESSIEMQIQINDLSGVSVKTNELVVLLSNLLDNAIEACCRLDNNRIIHVSIIAEESLFVSIKNTSPPVEIINGTVVSSKTDKYLHGYGLPNVRHILTMLQAEFTFAYEDGWFCFATEIPMCMKK